MKNRIPVFLATLLIAGCAGKKDTTTDDQQLPSDAGWLVLFDGTSKDGWHIYNHTSDGSAWIIDDGALHLDPSRAEGRGDLVTDREFENFELELEWKIDSCGNSGIMFNVVESPEYAYTFVTGPEMQVLDNACHPDAKIARHRAGDLYDLIASRTETVKPAGEWNSVRIRSNQGHVEFWLNDVQVVTFTMHTPEWDSLIAGSKFKDMPGFGKARRGRIALQDHNDRVWYRNIRIRDL